MTAKMEIETEKLHATLQALRYGIATIRAQKAEIERLTDMANVGGALMEAIHAYSSEKFMKGWAPADCPSEIVGDLLNALEAAEARATAAEKERDALMSKKGGVEPCVGCGDPDCDFDCDGDYNQPTSEGEEP